MGWSSDLKLPRSLCLSLCNCVSSGALGGWEFLPRRKRARPSVPRHRKMELSCLETDEQASFPTAFSTC